MAKDEITVVDALYGFAAWLTSREQGESFGSHHNASPAAELLNEFLDSNGINDSVSFAFPGNLTYPSEKDLFVVHGGKQMKVTHEMLDGTVIRDNETYLVEDNTDLDNLVLSKTVLHAGKQTTGHSHDGLEEIYFFTHGCGNMKLGDRTFDVRAGDIVQIPAGDFHQVFNTDTTGSLNFTCVFQTYTRED